MNCPVEKNCKRAVILKDGCYFTTQASSWWVSDCIHYCPKDNSKKEGLHIVLPNAVKEEKPAKEKKAKTIKKSVNTGKKVSKKNDGLREI